MSEDDDAAWAAKHKLPPLPGFTYEEIQSGSKERLKEILRLLGNSKSLPRTEENMRLKILDDPRVALHEQCRKEASMSEGNEDLAAPLSGYTPKNLRQLAHELKIEHKGLNFGQLKTLVEKKTSSKKRKRIYFPDEAPVASPLVQVRIIPRAVQSPRTPRAKKRLDLGAPPAAAASSRGKKCRHSFPKCLSGQCAHKCCR